jgi:hypothetical protein
MPTRFSQACSQLPFFLDDLLPSLFGKPLLSDQPNRSQIVSAFGTKRTRLSLAKLLAPNEAWRIAGYCEIARAIKLSADVGTAMIQRLVARSRRMDSVSHFGLSG